MHLNRYAVAVVLAVMFAAGVMSSSAAQTSDRERVVAIAQKLEAAPLDPALVDEREWAVAWLSEAPDITVTLCAPALAGWDRDGYPYAGKLLFPYMLSMAAFVITHPDAAKNVQTQQLAGVEATLSAYRAILKAHPEAHSPGLESLLTKQAQGSLPNFVKKALARC